MRDIKPRPPAPTPPEPPGELPHKVPQLPTPTPRPITPSTLPRLAGAKVPVANIQVPPPKKILRSEPLKKPLPPRPATPPASPVRIGHRERKFVVALVALAGLAALIAGFIFIPKAEIQLQLRSAPLLVDEQLTIVGESASDTTAVPGSAFFREVQVQGSSPTTSTEVIGAPATGTAVLINRTFDEQKIKERSRLVTSDDTLFYMQRSATIPPATAGNPGSVTVSIEAAAAGEEGNIEPQRLTFAALDTSAQTVVYAEVREALTGGRGDVQPIVHEADLEAARKAAGDQARTQVEQQIREELPNGWAILEESWASEVDDWQSPVALDSHEATVPFTARVAVRVMGYQQSALEDKLKAALEQRMDQEYMLFPGPISYSKSVEDINWEEGRATISARVTHTTVPRLSVDTLQQKLAGRSQAEAKEYLENLPGVRGVNVKLWPFWVTSIPRIDKRISLDFQSERQP